MVKIEERMALAFLVKRVEVRAIVCEAAQRANATLRPTRPALVNWSTIIKLLSIGKSIRIRSSRAERKKRPKSRFKR
ncbi:MAG: hypothetical protein WKG52_03525 [Variovorax sp.]